MAEETLLDTLHRLGEDCARDDAAMTKAPWAYDDMDARIASGRDTVAAGGAVGYENARMIIDEPDGLAIASARNRLPELAQTLKAAAAEMQRLTTDLDLSGSDSACCRARHRAEDERDQLRGRLQRLADKVDTAAQLLRAPVSGTMGKLMDLFSERDPEHRAELDLSDAHVDRVARRLFRAFDDASEGREPPHDYDVMAQCEYEGQPVVDNWIALAREAIRRGAVVPEEIG